MQQLLLETSLEMSLARTQEGHVIVDRQIKENSLSNFMKAHVCMTCVHNNVFSTYQEVDTIADILCS